MAPASTRMPGTTWERAHPAPLVLLWGPEDLFASRAVASIVRQVRERAGAVEVTAIPGPGYRRGDLRVATSPSLFDEPGVVVIEQAEAMNDECAEDLLAYAAAPQQDVAVVIRHTGVVRGKKVVEALRSAGASEFLCPALKRDADVVTFVQAEFVREGATAEPLAVRALVDALGLDVAELSAAVSQLARDVGARIAVADVARYYGSRVNVTGFAVADAAVLGKAGEALALVRHALETGTDPVPLIAALAMKLRTLVKVGAARGRGVDPARDFGLAPWQVDRARKELRWWTADTLAQAIAAVAQADADVKGAARAPAFAVERAVRTVASLAAS